MANSTAGTLIGFAQEKFKTDRSTVGLPGLESTHLLHVVDQADREWNRKFKIGGGEPRMGVSTEDGGTLASTTTLSADVADGAITLSVSDATDAVDGGGAGAVWDENMPDIFVYTDGSTTPITGVTGINFGHENGDTVQWLPQLPSDFGSFRGSDDNPHGVWVDGVPFQNVSGLPYGTQFRVYDNGTSKFLLFPQGLTGDYFIRYNKTGTVIDEESDNVSLPNDYEDFIVFRCLEHMYLTADEINFANAADRARIAANRILLDALRLRSINKTVRVGSKVAISSDYNPYSRLFPDTSI